MTIASNLSSLAPSGAAAETVGKPRDLDPQILSAIERCMLLSPGEAMRQDEAAAGRVVVRPGDVPWFSAVDWIDDVVVSRDASEVRIVSILARRTGQGAFRRLVTGICAAGLVPVVVEPMGVMPAILKRWRWRTRRVGEGWTSEVQARPRASWITALSAVAAATDGGRAHG